MYSIKAIADSVQTLPMFRGDANDAVFARHLVLATLQELFRREYTETKWATGELLPISQSVNEGAREYSYFELGQAGFAEIVADNATDIPNSTISGDLTLHKVHTVACSFVYSTQDIRQARLQGLFDIAAEKAAACREGHDQRINQLIRDGNAAAGLEGFTNHSGIIVQNTVSGVSWLTATAAQIVNDFSTAAAFIRSNSNGVEDPNIAVFPVDIFTRISTLQNSIASDITVLEFLQRSWPQIRQWVWEDGMKEAGAPTAPGGPGTPAVMIYNKNPMKARAVMPMTLRPLAVEPHGLVFKVVMESRFGGVMTPRPLSALRLDGVAGP
jgi:hypothetical protein